MWLGFVRVVSFELVGVRFFKPLFEPVELLLPVGDCLEGFRFGEFLEPVIVGALVDSLGSLCPFPVPKFWVVETP